MTRIEIICGKNAQIIADIKAAQKELGEPMIITAVDEAAKRVNDQARAQMPRQSLMYHISKLKDQI